MLDERTVFQRSAIKSASSFVEMLTLSPDILSKKLLWLNNIVLNYLLKKSFQVDTRS